MKIQLSWGVLRAIVYIVALLIIVELVRPRFVIRPEAAPQISARAQISSFRTALQLYKLDHGSYPTSLDELVVNKSGKNYLGDVLQLPKDPWGNSYRYTCPGTNELEFEVKSFGADGMPGGSYDNADILSWDLSSSRYEISK